MTRWEGWDGYAVRSECNRIRMKREGETGESCTIEATRENVDELLASRASWRELKMLRQMHGCAVFSPALEHRQTHLCTSHLLA